MVVQNFIEKKKQKLLDEMAAIVQRLKGIGAVAAVSLVRLKETPHLYSQIFLRMIEQFRIHFLPSLVHRTSDPPWSSSSLYTS